VFYFSKNRHFFKNKRFWKNWRNRSSPCENQKLKGVKLKLFKLTIKKGGNFKMKVLEKWLSKLEKMVELTSSKLVDFYESTSFKMKLFVWICILFGGIMNLKFTIMFFEYNAYSEEGKTIAKSMAIFCETCTYAFLAIGLGKVKTHKLFGSICIVVSLLFTGLSIAASGGYFFMEKQIMERKTYTSSDEYKIQKEEYNKKKEEYEQYNKEYKDLTLTIEKLEDDRNTEFNKIEKKYKDDNYYKQIESLRKKDRITYGVAPLQKRTDNKIQEDKKVYDDKIKELKKDQKDKEENRSKTSKEVEKNKPVIKTGIIKQKLGYVDFYKSLFSMEVALFLDGYTYLIIAFLIQISIMLFIHLNFNILSNEKSNKVKTQFNNVVKTKKVELKNNSDEIKIDFTKTDLEKYKKEMVRTAIKKENLLVSKSLKEIANSTNIRQRKAIKIKNYLEKTGFIKTVGKMTIIVKK